MLLLGLFALLAGLASWSQTEGYPVADAIENVDRAETFVETSQLVPDERNLRPFVFPFLFTPLFAAAELCGIDDLRFAMPVARALQLAMTVALVLASARLGARLFDRRTGLLGGYLVATCPTVLALATMPVSDVAAALLFAVAFERLLSSESPRRVLSGGVAAGIGFLVSYKALVLYALLAAALFLRDGLRRPRAWGALLGGLLLFSLAGCWIDEFVYGRFGHSLLNYLYDNVLGVLSTLTYKLGLKSLGLAIYELLAELRDFETQASAVEIQQKMRPTWYLRHVHEFLVPPVLALALVAGVRSLATLGPRAGRLPSGPGPHAPSRRWVVWTTFAILAGDLVVLSQKGNKSFRLLLPALPVLMPWCASAAWPILDALERRFGLRARRALRAAFGLLLVATAAHGFLATEPRAFGGYWQAVDYVNRREAARPAEAAPARMAASHYFAVYLRNGPEVEQDRFRFPPWAWDESDPSPATRVLRAQIQKTFSEVDWLLYAHTLLVQNPMLVRGVQQHAQVESAYFDRGAHSDQVGPVYVLARLGPEDDADDVRSFYRLISGESAESWAARHGFGEPLRFVGRRADGSPEELALLGWEYARLPETDKGWIRYHWSSATGFDRDYRVYVRWLLGDGTEIGANDHGLCYGALETSALQPGWVFTEGYLIDIDRLDASPPHAGAEPYIELRVGLREAGPDGALAEQGARLEPVGAELDERGLVSVGALYRLAR